MKQSKWPRKPVPQVEAQKIIDSIRSYMKLNDPQCKKYFLDRLRAVIDEFDPPPAVMGKAASGAEGQDNSGVEISLEQQLVAAVRESREKEKAAWEKWRGALAEHKAAKQKYDHWKKAEEYFETSVRPLNESFRQVTELLSYFVPCRTKADYEKRATVLLNKQRYLCGSLQPGKWGECLTSNRLSQLQFPDDEPPQVEMDTIPFEPSERPPDAIKSYEETVTALIEETSDYLRDLKRMENARQQHQRLWENASLLCDFLPAIEMLQQFEDAEDRAALAVEIGAKLADAVANHRCINPEMSFLWLFPNDGSYRESLSIRLDFILAEATCPGLYYRLGAGGTPICVIPGRIAEKE